MITTRLRTGAPGRSVKSPIPSFKILRQNSTIAPEREVHLRRSYLYVPTSSARMLQKSLESNSDVIIYDMEDSVPPSKFDKRNARNRLGQFIRGTPPAGHLHPQRIAARLNGVTTKFFNDDMNQVVNNASNREHGKLHLPAIRTLVMPKIHSAQDLDFVSQKIVTGLKEFSPRSDQGPLRIVASIESAKGLWNVGEIAAWKSKHGPGGGTLSALLFAAEDFCADTSIIRTPSRQELLYARSRIVIAAKAFGLEAIDMVCVNYKDLDYLRDECQDGRRLGFDGKQAIHPSQVDVIQSTYVPSETEILRAAKILHQMSMAHAAERGAVGLEMEGGGKEMIDAPMLKQAENTIRVAKAARIEIPDVGQADAP